jgi:hypothetical protein
MRTPPRFLFLLPLLLATTLSRQASCFAAGGEAPPLLRPSAASSPHAAPAVAWAVSPFEGQWFGLYDAARYVPLQEPCEPCPVPALVRHWFRHETAARPAAQGPAPVAGSPASALEDLAGWRARGGHREDRLPHLVWHGSPAVVPRAVPSPAGDALRLPDGRRLALAWAPRIAENRSWMDPGTFAWLDGRELRLRGWLESGESGPRRFVARTAWPWEWRLDLATLEARPPGTGESLAALMERDGGGARAPFEQRLLWERAPGSARAPGERFVLALMLNGAQGDDDEALGGHFAVVTGRLHGDGRIDHWLVTNFYGVDKVSEKGILPATLPMDAYMTDVNSGQQWYRPSVMLVAVLDDPGGPLVVQRALDRLLERFQRRHVEFDHARANCTGLSLDALEASGWRYPRRGPYSRALAAAGFFVTSLTERSFGAGRGTWHYLLEEQARLLPRAGFEVLGADLLDLLAGRARRAPSELERALRDSAVAVAWLRFPQIPSSRAFGRDAAASPADYLSRAPADRAQWKTIALEPRPYPDHIRDWRPPAPLLSDAQVGVAAFGLLGVALAAPPAWWMVRRRRARRRLAGGAV